MQTQSLFTMDGQVAEHNWIADERTRKGYVYTNAGRVALIF